MFFPNFSIIAETRYSIIPDSSSRIMIPPMSSIEMMIMIEVVLPLLVRALRGEMNHVHTGLRSPSRKLNESSMMTVCPSTFSL